ncbi:MAG TPA: hypothetical protein VFS30_14275 [Dehalococcoidia bacterium]|nr:hypothetical protein [Dehalococcoidia bacterium]
MKLKLSLLAAVGLAFAAMGLLAFNASAEQQVLSPVYWFEDTVQTPGTEVPGAYSTLLRSSQGVTANMHTSGLIPGHAYTFWWVLFNEPSGCNADGCGVDDVVAALGSGSNPANIGVIRGGGGVVGASGKFNVGASLAEGSTAGCQSSIPFVLMCNALVDASKAEIHLVLHDHGPVIAGQLREQIGSFEGGCKNFIHGPSGSENVAYGLGTYECFSPQASPHQP